MRWWVVASLLVVPVGTSADPLQDGKLLLSKRKYADAIPLFTQAAASDGSGEAQFCLAMAYELGGDKLHAIETYRKVVDGKGTRAAEAERSLKALESEVRELSALDTARIEFEKAGIDHSKRVQEAKQRAELATEAVIRHTIFAQKVQQAHDDVAHDLAKAQAAQNDADAQLAAWKPAGLHAPAGHGRRSRGLGILGITLGGIALGASAWYIRTNIVGQDEVEHPYGVWTETDDTWVKWGEISNARLKVTLPLGLLLTTAGIVSLSHGEAMSDEPAAADEVTRVIEDKR